MEHYTNLRKSYSKMIVILIYISFVCYFLGQIQSISDWSFAFHEMLFMPLNIAYFALPILCLMWTYNAIRSTKEVKKEVENKKDVYLKNILIMTSIFLIVFYFNYEGHNIQTSGVYSIEEKVFDGEKYNIIFNGMKINCTWNEYNLIVENYNYSISFVWNEYSPNKGKLEYIELVE